MTWQFVPPRPNELTPARIGLPGSVLRCGSVRTRRFHSSKAMAGFGGAEVGVGGDPAGVEADGDLDQAGEAGGAFEVSDVGLDGAHAQRVAAVAPGADDPAECLRLDGVALGGAGSVQFDVVDVARFHPGAGAGGAERGLLAGDGRRDEAVGAAFVADGAAAQHAVDAVAVGEGRDQRLQQDDERSFAAYETVRPRVEGVAAVVR